MAAFFWSMAADKLQYAIGNSSSTTLSSAITNSGTSAPLTSDTNFSAKSGEGMVIIDEGQAGEELAYATGASGGALTIPLANRGLEGGSAQAHNSGATVKGVVTAGMWNNMIDALALLVSKATGAINKASQAEVGTGTDDAKIVTPLGASIYANNSLYRQALINGNFDVNQRAASSYAPVDNVILFGLDHWYDYHAKDGGTLPTLTRSRQSLTPGDIPGSFYSSRLAFNGAGTSLGVNSNGRLLQKIEHGTRLLCGLNKEVTVSFWAKSDVSGKKLGVSLGQSYGSGGSPSSSEVINGDKFTLSTSWQKFTHTFTTNTLSGKTFGTANDDSLDLQFWYMWGSTIGSRVNSSGVAETYIGSGFVDIAQIQLCAGDVALPFMPKSYEEELRACQRYCYGITTTSANEIIGFGSGDTATNAYIQIKLPVSMRTIPTLTATASDWKIGTLTDASLDVTSLSILNLYQGTTALVLSAGVASGVTAYRPYHLVGDGTAGRTIIFSSEL